MSGSDRNDVSTVTLRPVSRCELEERIERLITDVAGAVDEAGAPSVSSSAAVQPRWIDAAELVRRMQPYLVYN